MENVRPYSRPLLQKWVEVLREVRVRFKPYPKSKSLTITLTAASVVNNQDTVA